MAEIETVVFDYGLVLSGPQSPSAISRLLEVLCIGRDRFEQLYWARRGEYDRGGIDGWTYWQEIAERAGRSISPALINRLIQLDGEVWLTENSELLEWQSTLSDRGINSAILSNMGDRVADQIEHNCPWIGRFEIRIWSYAVGMTKPDPRIFKHLLELAGSSALNTLFIDDRLENCLSARRLGIEAIQYTCHDAWHLELARRAPELL